MNHLGDRLKAVRKHNRQSQQEMADALGLSTAGISIIESSGKTSEETIDAICKHYKVTREWLVTGDGESPKGVIIPIRKELGENPYKDALVMELKEEIEFYKELLRNLTGGGAGKQSFLKVLSKAGGRKPLLSTQAA